MNRVAIVTDSTAGLSAEACRELSISVVPLLVNWDGKTYQDGIDIQAGDFYKKLEASKTVPTTSQPSVAAFEGVYAPLIEAGSDILTLPISSKLSGTFDSATQASQLFPSGRIKVMDSLQASVPLALLVLAAARAAQKGASLLEVVNLVSSYQKRIRTLFVVETLEYLRKGGRIGAAASFLGTTLNLKPILELKDGVILPLEKVRTSRKAIARAFEIVEKEVGKQASQEFFGIACTEISTHFEEILKTAREKFRIQEEIIGILSPVLGTHTGPGTLALVYLLPG